MAAWSIEPFWSLLAVALHRPLEADLRHPEGAHNLRLLGIAVDAKLGGDHTKRGHVRFLVDEHRHAAVKVGHPPVAFAERQQWGDVGDPFGEERKRDLRHRYGLRQAGLVGDTADPPNLETGIVSESVRDENPRRVRGLTLSPSV